MGGCPEAEGVDIGRLGEIQSGERVLDRLKGVLGVWKLKGVV